MQITTWEPLRLPTEAKVCVSLSVLGGGATARKSLESFKNYHCHDPTLGDSDSVCLGWDPGSSVYKSSQVILMPSQGQEMLF